MLKVLNLYAGIGGNRKLWEDVEVTAVEYKSEIAKIYKHFFPDDKVVVADAHKFLLDHYKEYDFIWSSPPCPTHSRLCQINSVQGKKMRYPDMRLYEEVLFLKAYFKGKYAVENVISWYDPLVKPFNVGSHYFWCNYIIPEFKDIIRNHSGTVDSLQDTKGFNLEGFSNIDKIKTLRNCVESELGLHVFISAFRNKQELLF